MFFLIAHALQYMLGKNRVRIEARHVLQHVVISGFVCNQKVQCPVHTPARNKRNAPNSSSITVLLILFWLPVTPLPEGKIEISYCFVKQRVSLNK